MKRILLALAALLLGGHMDAYAAHTETAIFAGGCFWCMEPEFDNAEGVVETVVGYTGGNAETAEYKKVGTGTTGHVEVIQVRYDPARITYDRLLDIFWGNIDPFDAGGQFADRGSQYITAIYYADESQKKTAEESLRRVGAQFPAKAVATRILPATPFYPAEEYHQEYYKKNSGHYQMYKYGSGRPATLESIWGKKEGK